MKNNDINNITLPVFKKLEKFAKETNEKLDNVDTSPVYEIPSFTITPKQLEAVLGITTPITTGPAIFFKCKCQGRNYNMAYQKLGDIWLLEGYNATYYIDCVSRGYEESFTNKSYQLSAELSKINNIRLVSCENITDLKPNSLGITVGTTADETFLLKDSRGLHLAHFYKATAGVPAYRHLVVENIYPLVNVANYRTSFSYELYIASSDTDTFTLSSSSTLYAPNSYTAKEKTLALKSDILNEYRKNKLGIETYTTVTTLQGLVDICDGILIHDDTVLYIRINQGKYIDFNIGISDLTNLSFTYNNNTYVYGVDFSDIYVVFEGIEVLFSFQEGRLEFPDALQGSYVGDLSASYINILDTSDFIRDIHLHSMLKINNGVNTRIILTMMVLSDTRLGIVSV